MDLRALKCAAVIAASCATWPVWAEGSGTRPVQQATRSPTGAMSGVHDFDFEMGSWSLPTRRMTKPLQGSNEWEEFDATAVGRPLLGGMGNMDEFRTARWSGLTLRFFNPQSKKWSIYWVIDFEMGSWKVHNRKLKKPLQGSREWVEFESSTVGRPVLNGLGNLDEHQTDHWPGFMGVAMRFFNPETEKWSIYLVNNRLGVIDTPVVGSFSGGIGTFEARDTFDGKPILVRHTWTKTRTPHPHWEQAFSTDGGKTWEVNWTNDLTRVADSARGGK
jgi:hypothetical protein